MRKLSFVNAIESWELTWAKSVLVELDFKRLARVDMILVEGGYVSGKSSQGRVISTVDDFGIFLVRFCDFLLYFSTFSKTPSSVLFHFPCARSPT